MHSTPHVAVVIENAGGAGAVARVAINQAEQLSRYFQVSIITDVEPKNIGCKCEYIILNVRRFTWMHRLCHVPNQLSFLWSVAKGLERLNEKHSIDLVWCHSHPVAAWPLYRFQRRHQVPYGMTVHGDIFERPAGTYDFWLTLFYKVATPRAYARATITQVLAPFWVGCAERWGPRNGRTVVIPNGIFVSELGDVRDCRCQDNETFNILYVGRLSIEKGVEYLLQSAKILNERGFAYHLDLIGEGPEMENLTSYVLANRLEAKVRFRGRVPRNRLGCEYIAADVVCVPSVSEALATVILESLSLGTPVVATNVGGNPYMIRDGWNGRLVTAKSPEALAVVLEELITHPFQVKELAENTKASVAEKFSWNYVGDQMAKLIFDCLKVSMPDGRDTQLPRDAS